MAVEPLRITLINLYTTETMAKYLLSSYVLKAYLEKYLTEDCTTCIEVLNFSTESGVSEICEVITGTSPDYVGYSCYLWNIEKILEIVAYLKGRFKTTHILGGPEISLNRIRELPDPSLADYYVIGEGERTLYNLLKYLNKKTQASRELPPGVACWNKNELTYTPNTESITDLDEIPSIYLTGVLEDRLYSRQQAFLETQRGCRYKCKYCVYHKNLSSISYYSEQRINDELEYLIVQKKIMALRIIDAVFTSNLPRAKSITEYLVELKNRGIRLPWIFWEFTYRDVDEEFFKLIASLKYRDNILNTETILPLDRPQLYSDLLKDYTVVNSIGVESMNTKALKAVGRPGINTDKFVRFLNTARKYNIALKLDIILGLPFETTETYFNGLEFLLTYLKNTDHILNIHLLSILPGSDLDDLCESYGIRYSKSAPHLVHSTNGFSAEELGLATKLSAVLFRVLNSPLRGKLYAEKERKGKDIYRLLEEIYDKIASSPELRDTRLITDNYVDDDYWNSTIYEEIPSQWLINYFEKELAQ